MWYRYKLLHVIVLKFRQAHVAEFFPFSDRSWISRHRIRIDSNRYFIPIPDLLAHTDNNSHLR